MTYSYSINEENYDGQYDTPEEAAQACFHEYPDREACWVGEAVRPQPEHLITASDVIEHILNFEDQFGWEGADWPEASKQELADLDARLTKVMEEWMDAHDLRPKFWNIENARVFKREDIFQEEV